MSLLSSPESERDELRQKQFGHFYIQTLKNGVTRVRYFRWARISFVVFSALILFLSFGYCSLQVRALPAALRVLSPVCFASVATIAAIAVVELLHWIGYVKGAKKLYNNFVRAGIVNHANEAPVLIKRAASKELEGMEHLVFYSVGFPAEYWEENRHILENAINCNIVKTQESYDKRTVRLDVFPPYCNINPHFKWDWSLMSEIETELLLGNTLTGPLYADIRLTPHILIGGGTGSGKTVLMKSLLAQCAKNRADIRIIDYKGRVDFSPYWDRFARFATDPDSTRSQLEQVSAQMESRKRLLADAACTNAMEYNSKFGRTVMRPVIVACDEAAAMTDTTGASKEEKAVIADITRMLSRIASQGRAADIHLFLATQRPDANLIPPQVRANCDFRICGRADTVLSQIILDSSDARHLVPKDAQGRFVTNGAAVFQAPYFYDRLLNEIAAVKEAQKSDE